MSVNYVYIIGIAIALLLAIWILMIELRLKKLFRGTKAKDIESVIASLRDELEKLKISQGETEKYLETVERRLKNSIQNVNTIRFNPFAESGPNQSFTISFLNEHGDGVVISSLYSREKVSVYAKPIKNYQSEFTLSDEEKKAIETAKS